MDQGECTSKDIGHGLAGCPWGGGQYQSGVTCRHRPRLRTRFGNKRALRTTPRMKDGTACSRVATVPGKEARFGNNPRLRVNPTMKDAAIWWRVTTVPG